MLLSLSSMYSPKHSSLRREERASFRRNTLAIALGMVLAGSGHAAITWTGANSSNFGDSGNWNPAHSGTGFSSSVYINGAGTPPLLEALGATNWLDFADELLVGSGSGANGSLGMAVNPAESLLNITFSAPAGALAPLFRIGDAGGTGTTDIDLMTPPLNPQTYPRVFVNMTWGWNRRYGCPDCQRYGDCLRSHFRKRSQSGWICAITAQWPDWPRRRRQRYAEPGWCRADLCVPPRQAHQTSSMAFPHLPWALAAERGRSTFFMAASWELPMGLTPIQPSLPPQP